MRRHWGFILGASAVTSLILGTLGFLACDAKPGVLMALYRAVQLFYWNYFPWNTAAETTLPWTLEVARWLAPLTTLGALTRVAVAVFQRQWNAFRAERMHGHVVICGADVKGAVLARELEERGSRVVLIEPNEERAQALEAEGFPVIPGDATKPDVLRRAGTPRAARLFATTPDDHENLVIAMTAAELGAAAIHAQGSSAALCDLYGRQRALERSPNVGDRVRVFDYFRNAARWTLRNFAPERDTGEVQVVLPELPPLGQALAVEYALMGHFSGDRRVHLHVAGPNAMREVEVLKIRHPGIAHCVTLTAEALASEELFCRHAAALAVKTDGTLTIFPDLTDGNRAFSRALEVLENTRSHPAVRVIVPAAEDSPMRAMVARYPGLAGRVGFLPLPKEICGYEAVIGESLDRTARTIHENWLQETAAQITAARASGDEARARRHETKATHRPWDDLSEEQKGASRSQADHIPFKIRAAGLDPATATAADWARLSAETVETLARMEHARWAAYYWMTGWTFAPARNDEAKQHPDLVDYDQLDEPTKDYDRAAVRNLGKFPPFSSAEK